MSNTTSQTEPTTAADTLSTSTLWERRDFLNEKYVKLLKEGTRGQWDEFSGNFLGEGDFANWEAMEYPLDWLGGENCEGGELHSLNILYSEIGGWAEDTTMVRESHFVEYAQNWIEGLHDIPDCINFCVDWNKFADSLRSEWSTFDFMGEEYLAQNC